MDNYFVSGDWNAICDVCGIRHKASQLRKRWDGVMVCKDDWNPRHPLDFLKAPAPEQSPPWTRPPGSTQFIDRDDD